MCLTSVSLLHFSVKYPLVFPICSAVTHSIASRCLSASLASCRRHTTGGGYWWLLFVGGGGPNLHCIQGIKHDAWMTSDYRCHQTAHRCHVQLLGHFLCNRMQKYILYTTWKNHHCILMIYTHTDTQNGITKTVSFNEYIYGFNFYMKFINTITRINALHAYIRLLMCAY